MDDHYIANLSELLNYANELAYDGTHTDIALAINGKLASLNIRSLRLQACKLRLEEIEAQLTPEGGWVGSNPDQRKASKLLALSGSDEWNNTIEEIRQLEEEVQFKELGIKMFENVRRAKEWETRLQTYAETVIVDRIENGEKDDDLPMPF